MFALFLKVFCKRIWNYDLFNCQAVSNLLLFVIEKSSKFIDHVFYLFSGYIFWQIFYDNRIIARAIDNFITNHIFLSDSIDEVLGKE